MRARLLLASSLVLTFLALTHPAWAWSNGHYTTDLNNPDYGYGTHDWIAERALDWLPQNEKALILTYRAWYLYGTELPDNHNAIAGDGIGDQTCCHHVYFFKNQTLQDGVGATRASAMGTLASEALSRHDYANASKWTGAMSHYISDLASFGHVLGVVTEWGAEPESVHGNYEDHMQTLTNSRDANVIPTTVGMLTAISPYDAAVNLARDTTFDLSGMGHTAVWMNHTDNWNNPDFTARAYQSLNLAVEYVADAVHYVWSTAIVTTTTTQRLTTTSSSHVVINEFEQDPPGADNGSSEWVELFNPTNQAVDLSGWKLIPTNGPSVPSVTIRSGSNIPPLGYYVVNRTRELGVQSDHWLNNDWEIIVLKDAADNTVDTTRNATDTQNGDRSWQRFPNGQDTDSDADWAPTLLPATKGVSNGGEVIVTTTTTQQQTTTTTEQLTTTSTTWSATTTQQVTTSTTQVQTTTTSTQQQTTTTTTQQHTTTWTSQQYTTTTQTGPAQTSGMGFAFAVIGIGAGVAAAGVGVAVAASGPSGSGVYAYGGYYYCRKHRVPLLLVGNRLWCPIEGRFIEP